MCQQTHLGFPWKGRLKQAVQASKAGLHRFWFGGYSSSTGMRVTTGLPLGSGMLVVMPRVPVVWMGLPLSFAFFSRVRPA